MIEVESLEKLREVIASSKLVLVLIYDRFSPQSRYLSSLVDDLAYRIEPQILVVKVDTSEVPEAARELGEPPRLLLFIEGERVWQQIGFFYNYYSDMYAIRRGILYALRSRNMTPRSLGIRLR
jgi:thioredoxin-like negative regulator of GroEL